MKKVPYCAIYEGTKINLEGFRGLRDNHRLLYMHLIIKRSIPFNDFKAIGFSSDQMIRLAAKDLSTLDLALYGRKECKIAIFKEYKKGKHLNYCIDDLMLPLRTIDKLLLIYLRGYDVERKGQIEVFTSTIQADLDYSKTTLYRSLNRLEKDGYIRRETTTNFLNTKEKMDAFKEKYNLKYVKNLSKVLSERIIFMEYTPLNKERLEDYKYMLKQQELNENYE